MLVRNTKYFFIVTALFFSPGIGTQPVLAQTCTAKTCSQAFSACTGKHCSRERTGNSSQCYRFCQTELERCMKTGEFNGRVCQKHGLIRK